MGAHASVRAVRERVGCACAHAGLGLAAPGSAVPAQAGAGWASDCPGGASGPGGQGSGAPAAPLPLAPPGAGAEATPQGGVAAPPPSSLCPGNFRGRRPGHWGHWRVPNALLSSPAWAGPSLPPSCHSTIDLQGTLGREGAQGTSRVGPGCWSSLGKEGPGPAFSGCWPWGRRGPHLLIPAASRPGPPGWAPASPPPPATSCAAGVCEWLPSGWAGLCSLAPAEEATGPGHTQGSGHRTRSTWVPPGTPLLAVWLRRGSRPLWAVSCSREAAV